MHKLKYIFRFLFSFLFIFGIVLVILGFNDYKIIDFSYQENNDIGYRVYLKENNFFESEYLEENRTYISSLIDYIDINYHYNIKYSLPVSGSYNYKLVAIISANKNGSDEYYWKKEYSLTEEKTGSINNSTELTLDENVKISYDKYNEILNKFKKEYTFASEGNLKIAMIVNNNTNSNLIEEPIIINSDINLSIPLMEQTVEASINKDASNASDVLQLKEKNKDFIYLIYKIIGITLVIISTIYFMRQILSKRSYNKKHKYKVYLNKILKSYDSIIANVNNKPILDDLKKIEVSSFSELLDIYNEVRLPINYYQDSSKKISIFVIYNENLAWIYELRKEDFNRGGNGNVKKENTRD